MFVEGGSATLTAIANQGGYNAGGNYGDVNKEFSKENLSEGFFTSFETNYGRGPMYVEVFRNPSSKEFKECKPNYEVGALLTDKDIYVWNREKAYHRNVMEQLKLHDCLSLLLMPDNTNINRMDIMITDASRTSKWHHSPKAAEFIRNHPFFKNKQVDNISYWDEDIEGDWEKLKEIKESYADSARFGLGAIGSNDDVQFKEFSRDVFGNQIHGRSGNPYGRRRFRYMGGVVEWSDCVRPDEDQKMLVDNYLERRGFPVKKHTSIYDEGHEDYMTNELTLENSIHNSTKKLIADTLDVFFKKT